MLPDKNTNLNLQELPPLVAMNIWEILLLQ